MLIGTKIFRPTAFLIVLWFVLSESYSSVSTPSVGLSNRLINRKGRSLLPKQARMMFSGIVEEMGTIEILKVNPKMVQWDGSIGEGVELTVNSKVALGDAYIGCSIAVNGVCLTAISFDDKQFTVGLAPETLRRSNLGLLVKGSKVNLERALKADGRNSGHFVQGHVDCTGDIVEKFSEGDSMWFKIQVPSSSIKYIVPKGFVCVDGTSLTICEVDAVASTFTFMLVAHTQQNVIIPNKIIGEKVNIEVDVLAKMVERSLAGVYEGKGQGQSSNDAAIAALQARIDKLESSSAAAITSLEAKVAKLEEALQKLMK